MSGQDQGHSGKKRTTYQKNDDDILAHIVKNADGGRLWKTIKEGASTAQQKYVAWETVTKLFNHATGYDLDRQQVRAKYQRLKDKKKKEADKRRLEERNYTRSCLATGGGPGPSIVPEIDGDKDNDLSLEEAPLSTDWNSFTSSVEDRENIPPPNSDTLSLPQMSNPVYRYPGGPRVRFPLRLDSSVIPTAPVASSRHYTTGHRHTVQGQQPPVSQVGAGGAREQTGPDQILLVTENGEHTTVSPASEPAQTPKTKKTVNKKDMNEAASNYYTELLIIQKEVAQKKIELLKKKIKNEELKEKMLIKQARKEGESDDIQDSDLNTDEDGTGDGDDSISDM